MKRMSVCVVSATIAAILSYAPIASAGDEPEKDVHCNAGLQWGKNKFLGSILTVTGESTRFGEIGGIPLLNTERRDCDPGNSGEHNANNDKGFLILPPNGF